MSICFLTSIQFLFDLTSTIMKPIISSSTDLIMFPILLILFFIANNPKFLNISFYNWKSPITLSSQYFAFLLVILYYTFLWLFNLKLPVHRQIRSTDRGPRRICGWSPEQSARCQSGRRRSRRTSWRNACKRPIERKSKFITWWLS
jgi:hypothetical protein